MLHLSRSFAAWQFSFRFQSDDPALLAYIGHCYRDLPAAAGEALVLRARRLPSGAYDLVAVHPDGTEEVCSAARGGPALVEMVSWEVNRRARDAVAASTVLHAAVIGGPAGVVALCGSSGSGKSTLCAAAARRGWWHLSDDLALVDIERVTVAPYARPLMLRPGGRDALAVTGPIGDVSAEWAPFVGADRFLPASELGATIVREPQPLVAIGVLDWGAAPSVTPLGRARTLHAMAEHSATLAARGGPGFDDLVRVAEQVVGYSVVRGAADEVLDLLGPLVGQAART